MQLGKYEIISELGRGGFGVVYEAKDLTLDRTVALKVLHPQLAADVDFVRRFQAEAKSLAKLEHPNIVPVYEINEVEGRYFIAMRYLPGASLADRLASKGSIPQDEVLALTRQLIAGLSHAHAQRLVHCDLKPNNILFDSFGNAMITDFGLTRAAQTSRSSSISIAAAGVGTPEYMAPEMWESTEVDPAVDQYSLACMISEMLTGQKLFFGETTPIIMLKHFKPVILPDEIPAMLRPILHRALAMRPQDRFQTLTEMQQALDLSAGSYEIETQTQDRLKKAKNFIEQGDPQAALPDLERLFNTVPELARPLYSRALIMRAEQKLQAGKLDEAMRDYNASKELFPDEQTLQAASLGTQKVLDAYVIRDLNIAQTMLAQGQMDAAIAKLDDIYYFSPDKAAKMYGNALLDRGRARLQSGDVVGAKQDFRKGLSVVHEGRLKSELEMALEQLKFQSTNIQDETESTDNIGHPEMKSKKLVWLLILIPVLFVAAIIFTQIRQANLLAAQARWTRLEATQTADAQLGGTQTFQTQFAETKTAQATATSAWDEYNLAISQAKQVLGPYSGELVHIEDDSVQTYYIGDKFHNFALQVTFTNPGYAEESSDWDFGLLFRDGGGNDQFRLSVIGNGSWNLLDRQGDSSDAIIEGELILNTGSAEENELVLLAIDDRGIFFLNGNYVATLDLSARSSFGSLALGTGFYNGDERDGAVTNFSEATLYVLDSSYDELSNAITDSDAFVAYDVYTDNNGVQVREAHFPVIPARKVITTSNLDQITTLGLIGNGEFTGLSLSYDFKMLAVGTEFGIYILNPEDLSEIRHFASSYGVLSLTFFPGDHRIAAIQGHDLWIWNADTGELLDGFYLDFYSWYGISVSVDGTRLAISSIEDEIFEVDPNTGIKGQVLKNHYAWDGAESSEYWFEEEDGVIKKVQKDSGTEVVITTGFYRWLQSIKLNPGNESISGIYNDQRLRVWDFSNGKVIAEQPIGYQYFSTTIVNHVCLIGGYELDFNVWDLNQHQVLKSVESSRFVHSFDLSPDGHTYAVGSQEGETILFDLKDSDYEILLGDQNDYISDINFSPDGQLIASGSFDQSVSVWEVSTGNLLYTFDFALGNSRLAFSSDSQLLAATGDHLAVWNMDDGRLVFENFELNTADRVVFSPSGEILAVYLIEGDLYLLNPITGQTLHVLTAGREEQPREVLFSDDGKMIVTANWDGLIRIWGIP
jgi:serine/threonine protein kinase/WD40 repeat protein